MIPAPLVIAINGIRTSTTEDSWPKRLAPYLESRYRCYVEAHYYRTGPIAPWNLWGVNPRIAKVLASSIEARMEEIGIHPLHIVAHSNGTNIAIALCRELARRGIRVETLVLIASALHSDIAGNGLDALVTAHDVRRAVAYCSPDDLVVRRLQAVPGFYGSLGSKGFEWKGKPTGLRVAGYQASESSSSTSWTWCDRSLPRSKTTEDTSPLYAPTPTNSSQARRPPSNVSSLITQPSNPSINKCNAPPNS